MHEYPVTKHIIELVNESALAGGAKQVTKVHLVVGEQSGFIGDSIQMYFDVLAKGTLTEGAVLSIKYIKSLLKCRECGLITQRIPYTYDCPTCQGALQPTDIGKEFYIEDIEILCDN